MTANSSLWLLISANLVLVVALLTFAAGFFPHKPFLPGRNDVTAHDAEGLLHKPFSKVVFVVIDALRSDFVYSNNSGFSFLQGLVRTGAAIPFTAFASSPTVTMPKIKAITTGSVPSFLDAILNLAESDTTSTLTNQDNWPSQLKSRSEGKIAMFGDDTWIKLFPGLFDRSDGTTSFFVSDFIEVDNNVTRHVDPELQKEDWNGMILHYLGLDHIGHKAGPKSSHMIPKQHEMDAVVQKIYRAIESKQHLQSTLLIVCGDHGMNDAGNHGGSSPGETSPALVFISPKFKTLSSGSPCPSRAKEHEYEYFTRVMQADLVPTLAGLLDFPIPLNNLGVFIPEMLGLWPYANADQRVALLESNARQILFIIRNWFHQIPFDDEPLEGICASADSDGTRLHCEWATARGLLKQDVSSKVVDHLIQFMRQAQTVMTRAASDYHVTKLVAGTGFAALSFVLSLISLRADFLSCQSALHDRGTSYLLLWLLVLSLSHGLVMFASSLVEEEHQYWNWVATAWFSWLYLSRYTQAGFRSSIATLLVFFAWRIASRWNQAGQKRAGSPDIATSSIPQNQHVLWVLVILSYLYMGFRLGLHGYTRRSFLLLCAIALSLVAALRFKVSFTQLDAPELLVRITLPKWLMLRDQALPLVMQAQLVFYGLLFTGVIGIIRELFRSKTKERCSGRAFLVDLLAILLVTQTRTVNIPLLLLFEIQILVLRTIRLHDSEITISLLILQRAAFFAYGRSNAISSIDLSNAYNGVTKYNPSSVGILTFVSNWAGPIWWSTRLTGLPIQGTSGAWKRFQHRIGLLTVFECATTFSLMVACTILRTHLFIWTVFSPNYLFNLAWTLGHHLLVNVLLEILLQNLVRTSD